MATVSPGSSVSVPHDFAMWRLAQRVGVPPWVLEGFAHDRPPIDWLFRLTEFARLEAQAVPRRGVGRRRRG